MALITHKQKVGSNRIYNGEIVSLRVDELQHPLGHHLLREVVEHKGGVVIACQPDRNQVILIKQYRYSIDEDLLELPAGRLEPGELPLPAAQRELIEETGYEANVWQKLSGMYSAPGFCNEVLHLYHATDITFVGKNLDEDEETEVFIVTLQEAWQLIRESKILDAKTIAGIALLSNL